MPKVYCYLNQHSIDQLEQIKKDEGYESSSQAIKEIINLGLKVYAFNKGDNLTEEEKNRQKKEDELKEQHTMYLLRLLALNADILRCVYDPSKLPDSLGTTEEYIAKVKQKVEYFIDGYINN